MNAPMNTPMKFADFQQQDRRLAVLQCLSAAVQYRAHVFLIQRYCDAVGHSVSKDRLQTDLTWLAEQGLLEVDATSTLWVARLLEQGADVASGRAACPGVAKPQPGA